MMMPNSNILQLIKESYGNYSPQQGKVATYFLENYKKAAFMTATQLAKEVGVSQPTVIRFSQFFGFSQYGQFLEVVQDLLKAELTSVERLRLSLDESSAEEVEELNIISKEIRTLNYMAKTFPHRRFKKLVQKVCEGNRVVIVGTRGSAALAQHFVYYLDKVKRNVEGIYEGSNKSYDRLISLKQSDLVVGIAFPRYPSETLEIMQFCKKQGVNTAGITDKVNAPLAELVDIPLVIPITFSTLHDSFSSALCLFNMVGTEVGRGNHRESEELSMVFEDLAKKTNMFLKS